MVPFTSKTSSFHATKNLNAFCQKQLAMLGGVVKIAEWLSVTVRCSTVVCGHR